MKNKDYVFSAYDMSLMYNGKLLKTSIDSVLNCDFSGLGEFVKKTLNGVLTDSSILDRISFDRNDAFNGRCNRGCYFKYDNNHDDIFLGYVPELLYSHIVSRKGLTENYLFGVAVNKDLVDRSKLNNCDFCEDDNRIYFPTINELLLEGGPNNKTCSGESIHTENNLDICHSIITLEKMWDLISSSGDAIVEKLNSVYGGAKSFSLGKTYAYNGIECAVYINVDGIIDHLSYGLAPFVFDAGMVEPENAIISDCFSTVGIYKDLINSDSQSPYVKNGALFNDGWFDLPICRKLLCSEGFLQKYVDRIVEIIKEGLR